MGGKKHGGKKHGGKKRTPSQPNVAAPLIDGDGPPYIQRDAVLTAEGAVLRAPRLTRAEWADPTDTQALERDPNSPTKRRARTIRGYRAANVVERMHADMPREVTAEHVKAASRLLDDYEVGVMGAQTTARFAGHVDGSGAADMPQRQLDAIGRYHGAIAALGRAASELLGAVIFHGMTCEAVAAAIRSDRRRVVGRAQAALERLREHYWPEPPRRPAPAYPALPAPADPLSHEHYRLGRKDRPGRIRTLGAA